MEGMGDWGPYPTPSDNLPLGTAPLWRGSLPGYSANAHRPLQHWVNGTKGEAKEATVDDLDRGNKQI